MGQDACRFVTRLPPTRRRCAAAAHLLPTPPVPAALLPSRWMRFDDGQVFFVSQQQVLVQRPYLLFYQRVT